MEGVHIGNGAIIEAGAAVTKDCEIRSGNPAIFLKHRFLES